MDEKTIMQIRENMAHVESQVEQAARKAGRKSADIRLIVVTKGQPIDLIRAAVSAGAVHLGENYAEQAVPKIQELSSIPGLVWHMIGHVQSRKAGLVGEYFSMVQSLDSCKLADKLDEALSAGKRIMPVLLEMNVSGEESKYGWPAWDETRWPELIPDIQSISAKPNLKICGLMTMPPLLDPPDQARPFFRNLGRLQQYLVKTLPEIDWSELSMGTSADYAVAVEEGATMVRIGQAILGPRKPVGSG